MSFSIAIDKDGHIYYPVHLEFMGNIYRGKAFKSELTENTYRPNHSLTSALMSNNSVGKNKPRISILGTAVSSPSQRINSSQNILIPYKNKEKLPLGYKAAFCKINFWKNCIYLKCGFQPLESLKVQVQKQK